MSETTVLLCALPGAVLVIWNMWRERGLLTRVMAVAQKDHNWQFTQTSRGEMAALMRSPERFVSASDSPELVHAKRELLAKLPVLKRGHWLSFALLALGVIVGSLIA